MSIDVLYLQYGNAKSFEFVLKWSTLPETNIAPENRPPQ